MKDVIVTVACVVILGFAGFFGTYEMKSHQQQSAIAAMPQPTDISALKAQAAKDADATKGLEGDALKDAQTKADTSDKAYGEALANNLKAQKLISTQEAADVPVRTKASIIGGVIGVVVGIIVGVLVANTLNKKKAQ